MSTESTVAINPAHQPFEVAFFTRKVWLTYAIVTLNVLIFIIQVKFSASPAQAIRNGSDFQTLLNFGAKTNFWIINQGQWFRLLTPIFLHIGLTHLAINCYSIWQIGPIVERLYGPSRFAALYLLTGIGGSIGSLIGVYFGKVDVVSAGASGAIFGLLGVCLVTSYKYRAEMPAQFRRALGPGLMPVIALNLLFGFINNATAMFGDKTPLTSHFIGNSAHIGGLITGAIVALFIPYTLLNQNINSRTEKIMLWACILLTSFCFARAYWMRPFRF